MCSTCEVKCGFMKLLFIAIKTKITLFYIFKINYFLVGHYFLFYQFYKLLHNLGFGRGDMGGEEGGSDFGDSSQDFGVRDKLERE